MQRTLDDLREPDALLIDTSPNKHLHRKRSGQINVGLEIAGEILGAARGHWTDTIDGSKYETIGFNITYPTHMINLGAYLKRNGIEGHGADRSGPAIIAGGPGCQNVSGALNNIVDSVFYGEIDGQETDAAGHHRVEELTTQPIIQDSRAVLEIARGCNQRCGFCEYGHVIGGRYREKNIEIVKKQLSTLRKKTGDITLRTANLGAYSELEELATYCKNNNITQRWGDLSVRDAEKMLPHMKDFKLYTPKMGIESFDEATRRKVGKASTDDKLERVIKKVMAQSSAIHFYLIYGLPGDDYASWIRWARILREMRKKENHKIRIDFSITNFNPCPGTPLENAPLINFDEKRKFLKEWIRELKTLGFYKENWDIRPGRDFGRLGRNEPIYLMNYMLRYGGPGITENLLGALPRGVGRSISDEEAMRFLNYAPEQ